MKTPPFTKWLTFIFLTAAGALVLLKTPYYSSLRLRYVSHTLAKNDGSNIQSPLVSHGISRRKSQIDNRHSKPTSADRSPSRSESRFDTMRLQPTSFVDGTSRNEPQFNNSNIYVRANDIVRYTQTTIEYGGITWQLPRIGLIAAVKDAVILSSGLVGNKTLTKRFGRWYWADKEAVLASALSQGAQEKFEVLSLVEIWNDSFSHISFATIPKISLFCQFLKHNVHVKVLVMSSTQRDLVQLFCPMAAARFVFKRPMRSKMVYIPQFQPPLSMGIAPIGSVKPLLASPTKNNVILYLKRTQRKRGVSNEDEVLKYLRSLKTMTVEVFKPSNNWKKDRLKVQTAGILIGPHGGAFGNMLFVSAKTIVIEFLPLVELKKKNKNARPCYFGLAKAMNLVYYNVRLKKFDFNGPMEVDMEHLKTIIGKTVKKVSMATKLDTTKNDASTSSISNSDRWTIVVTVSTGFRDMFENWLYYFRKLNIKANVVIFAEDAAVRDVYGSTPGFTVIDGDLEQVSDAHGYESPKYLKLVSRRARYLKVALEKYKRIIYTDIDTVWLSDPRPYLVGNYDLWGQSDGFRYNLPYYCTGFLAFKHSARVIALLQKWENALQQKAQLNQPIFNILLHKDKSIIQKPLDRAKFPSGDIYFDQKKQNGVVVVHNNYIRGYDKKVARFKDNNLWHVTRELPRILTEDIQHVIFSTFARDNTHTKHNVLLFVGNHEQTKFIEFDSSNVSTNAHGTPILNDMYHRAFKMYPEAHTYTYFNGDIVFNHSFIDTLNTIYTAASKGLVKSKFLIVGRRTNVDWKDRTHMTKAEFDSILKSGKLFVGNAQDYFVVTKSSIDWAKIPKFVIGRPGYDNWLVDHAMHAKDIDVFDASLTIPAIHQTDKGGNFNGHKNRPDKMHNHKLVNGKGFDHGFVEMATFLTRFTYKGGKQGISIVERENKKIVYTDGL